MRTLDAVSLSFWCRWNPQDKLQIEMSFDLTAYQPHLADRDRIYQSIFLDDQRKASWTVDALDEKKVLKRRWTRQFAHVWQHFAFW